MYVYVLLWMLAVSSVSPKECCKFELLFGNEVRLGKTATWISHVEACVI
jgi:hypothetical protein